jgi:hypothetical protein
MAIFLRPLLFSCDSFLGSLALGFGVRSNRQRIGLVAAFSLCDALASIAGSLLSTTCLGETAPEVLAPGTTCHLVIRSGPCRHRSTKWSSLGGQPGRYAARSKIPSRMAAARLNNSSITLRMTTWLEGARILATAGRCRHFHVKTLRSRCGFGSTAARPVLDQ